MGRYRNVGLQQLLLVEGKDLFTGRVSAVQVLKVHDLLPTAYLRYLGTYLQCTWKVLSTYSSWRRCRGTSHMSAPIRT